MLRRSFLSRLGLAGATAFVGGAPSQPAAATQPRPPFDAARHAQDDWFDELPGKHRIIFDTFMSDMFGEAVGFVGNYISVNKDAYELGEKDIAVVLTVRHQTAPFAFNDAMWAKYGKQFSDRMKFVDPKTKEPPTANVYGVAARPVCEERHAPRDLPTDHARLHPHHCERVRDEGRRCIR